MPAAWLRLRRGLRLRLGLRLRRGLRRRERNTEPGRRRVPGGTRNARLGRARGGRNVRRRRAPCRPDRDVDLHVDRLAGDQRLEAAAEEPAVLDDLAQSLARLVGDAHEACSLRCRIHERRAGRRVGAAVADPYVIGQRGRAVVADVGARRRRLRHREADLRGSRLGRGRPGRRRRFWWLAGSGVGAGGGVTVTMASSLSVAVFPSGSRPEAVIVSVWVAETVILKLQMRLSPTGRAYGRPTGSPP